MTEAFSFYDVAGKSPERFYHGFVLGLVAALMGRYVVQSNRESGLGRYDVLLIPLAPEKDAGVIMEFKTVLRSASDEKMQQAMKDAFAQIEEKQYKQELLAHNVPEDRIYAYGFVFRQKEMIVGKM